ncbi:MAG: citrate synthase/methylcitrate synthase [Acidobacteriota bacterium]
MNDGLAGVVAAETILSEVDGERGQLIIRGYRLDELAGKVSFEAATALLWQDLAPTPTTLETVSEALGQARLKVFQHLPVIIPRIAGLNPTEALRAALASLSDRDETPHHYLVSAAIPVFIAAIARIQQGETVIEPDKNLSQPADLLRMMRGKRASSDEEYALTAYLVTVMEHGMNASTFTARVIAATQAGIISSVVGALCALKGPLHGGAPGPVLDMLDAIGNRDNINNWIKVQLAEGKRLIGFGHRIYRVRDPRADILKNVVKRLSKTGNVRLIFAEEVEQAALQALKAHKPDRPLHTNVEFYTALVLDVLGFAREMFTPLFAMGRVIGWTAHIFEQARTGKLIRPESIYIGPRKE